MSVAKLEASSIPPQAKWSFTTRRVNRDHIAGYSNGFHHAVSGDLILVEVVRVSSHKRCQLSTGRPSELSVGDYIVACVGDRYAPDQFEGRGVIDADGCDLLAAGGVVGKVNVAHAKMAAPTRVKPVALLTDAAGDTINIASYGLRDGVAPSDLTVICVVGASMNAGKTTATASLAHGLTKAGYKVAGIKATGTGAFGDFNAMLDAGLHYVGDFTDAGMATTYLQSTDNIERGLAALLHDAKSSGAEIAVVELADGIYQKETAELLERSTALRSVVNGVMFACGDAVSAVGGVRHLRSIGYDPIAVSGMVSLSPLAVREAEAMTNAKIYSRDELKSADLAHAIVEPILVDAPAAGNNKAA